MRMMFDRFFACVVAVSCIAFGCDGARGSAARAEPPKLITPSAARSTNAAPPPSAAAGLACLRAAYPEQVCSTEPNAVVLCDGTRLTYDDGETKTHAERLERPDLEDMLAQPYDLAQLPPGADIEPGRIRSTAFFDAMYGGTARAVGARLTRIAWMPSVSARTLQVSTANGVDARLRAVSAMLERLPAPARDHAAQIAGTFNFRDIAGTERKSAHSYGIAIDVAPTLGDYWRWREPGATTLTKYRNRIPPEIVAAFEREGFIWGGKWHHYDTMHFEYRPELLIPECRGRTLAAAPAPARPIARAPSLIAAPSTAPGLTHAPIARPHPPIAPAPTNAAPAAAPMAAEPSPRAALASDANDYAWLDRAPASTLRERIEPPRGYRRVPVAAGSFGAWLRELPLLAAGEPVRLYDGRAKPSQHLHVAIVDIDVGKRDLQQCADAVMRLRAEYLFASGRADDVCFKAVSGDAMPYLAYQKGLRPPPGRGGPWRPAAAADRSHAGFRTYLDRVFGIANTASLLRELEPVSASELVAGDVYIEAATGGRFGHAVLILDVAQNASGERIFLIAQSYMPAQQFHVLINANDRALSPWYRAPADGSLHTPEWSFPAHALRRFARSCR